MRVLAALLAAAAVATLASAQTSPLLLQREAYVMGTRVTLAAYARARQDGAAALETALAVLEGAEAELSTWRADSAISRLNAAPVGERWHASPALCPLFAELFRWHAATDGAFDPAVGALAALWQIHGAGRVADAPGLEDARRRSGLHLLQFDAAACTVTRQGETTLDAGAFGKGEALDRVAAALRGRAWMVDLGGQVAVGGTPPAQSGWTVALAHPGDRDRAVAQVTLTSGSLSTSGGSERDLQVGGTRVGHILDPRTGRPASFAGSVVVWHERGLIADILSTALYVMGMDVGLGWAESHGVAAAFLISTGADVRVAPTSAFATHLNVTEAEPGSASARERLRLASPKFHR